jgi:SAM-dependent methyltransferase
MPDRQAIDLFRGLRDRIERDPDARESYARRVARAGRILDVGGRNQTSRSAAWIRSLAPDLELQIVCTDVAADYGPDLVDDITRSGIPDASFDGIFCVSVLEHVEDYQAAMRHLHRILKPGGEIVLYAPFAYPFHDRTDHHRFTFTEIGRLMADYSDFRICLADGNGYGGVLLQVLTFHAIQRWPRLWALLSALCNSLLAVPLAVMFVTGRRWRGVSWRDFRFYFTHLHLAHGFWGWGRK